MVSLRSDECWLLTSTYSRLKPYMTQSQRARLEEVQSEKAGITFNHVQRVSADVRTARLDT